MLNSILRRTAVLLAACVQVAAARRAGAQLTPCSVAGLSGDVRCGSVDVFENRSAPSGRKIQISVIVARATDADRAPDPLFLFAGGPGQAASGMVDFANAAFSLVHRKRDLVFVDVRGTGKSNPLNCRLYRKPTDFLGQFYPEASVRYCRDSLGALADLRQYTTPNIRR